MKKIISISFFLLFVSNIISQNHVNDYINKVKSIDSIVSSIYEVVSGKKGEERDWKLHKTIFHPEARIISTYRNNEGEYEISFLSVDEYMKKYRSYFKGITLFEKDSNREIEINNNMAHVFSTFESYKNQNDSIPFKIGTASIQLYNDGERWYVLNMYYKNESKEDKVPSKYLPSH